MSFGIGVGDFLAVGKIAWALYRDCYLIARGAPQEFRLLVDELKTLHATMLVLDEETKDPKSILAQAGENRQQMLKEILKSIEEALNALNDVFRKHRKLGSIDRSSFKRQWDKFKWSVDAKDVDALRNKLTYHNGVLSLLLTCAGNSSLERIERSTKAIDAGVQELKVFLQSAQAGSLSPNPPLVSAQPGSGVANFDKLAFGEQCMRSAEILQPWTTIGIEDWIKAGRWWLLKVSDFLLCAQEFLLIDSISREVYINLLKASWILTDVIAAHPQ
ncbi:hypothetical protein BDZ91DRAFT_686858, partial [Kalaharituber pfeilii]